MLVFSIGYAVIAMLLVLTVSPKAKLWLPDLMDSMQSF